MLKAFVHLNQKIAGWLEKRFPATFGAPNHHQMMREMIVGDVKARWDDEVVRILEAGSVDRPFLNKHERVVYDGLDVDKTAACDDLYDHFFQQSITEPIPQQYDVILSRTMVEHLPDVRSAMVQMHEGLRPDGKIYHYYPCKNHPYAVILRLIGNRWQRRLIGWLHPSASYATGYPAYFDHCSYGETVTLLHDIGYTDIVLIPFYRANHYFNFFLPAYLLITLFENSCKRLDLTHFCSGIIVQAAK